MSYTGTKQVISAEYPHLGGDFNVGDPFSYCPSVWNYVISRFCVSSVLDLGSGSGHASDFFFRSGLRVVAVDGLPMSIENSMYPAMLHDLTKAPVLTRVDLVHCQEVVEHIHEQFLSNVVTSLMNGKIILMTHALPGQGGHHHVNEQPPGYWLGHMEAAGCSFLAEDSRRVRSFAAQDGAVYMARTGMLFVNNRRA